MRTKIEGGAAQFVGLLFPILLVSCAYGPCSDLKSGDIVQVTITKIYFGSDCRPSFELGEGSVLQLVVTDQFRGERCESATGSLVDYSGLVRFTGPLATTNEEEAHNDFFGRYQAESASCQGAGEISFALDFDGSNSTEAGISVDIQSTTCDSPCVFNAHGKAKRI